MTFRDNPPRSGCVPIALPEPPGSSWAVDRKNAVAPAPTVVLKLRPLGEFNVRPDGVSDTVAVFELYPGALAL